MSMNRIITALLAVTLALPAGAQIGRETAAERMRRNRQPTPPPAAPAPAPQAQAPASGQPAPGQSPLSEEQRVALTAVHYHSQVAAYLGDLAGTRAASQEVRDLGRSLAEDHRRIDGQLAGLLKERGTDINALPHAPNRPQLEGELRQLEPKTGEEFDREFVAFLTRNGVAFVDTLKRARDVTPGKDAALKRFLDDAENSEENHLAASRRLKAQRQARTPPAR